MIAEEMRFAGAGNSALTREPFAHPKATAHGKTGPEEATLPIIVAGGKITSSTQPMEIVHDPLSATAAPMGHPDGNHACSPLEEAASPCTSVPTLQIETESHTASDLPIASASAIMIQP